MKRTPLYDQHVRDASAVINLKGFARAMQYRGHALEHKATREQVTVCDVSHMGELEFKGPDALALVQKLITNDAARLAVNQALYSAMCDERGILLDDLVCYRLAADRFVWVVNVTKTDDDYQWALKHSRGMDVQVTNISTETALIALQGPHSRETLQRIAQADLSNLKYYWLTQTIVHTRHAEVPCIISRTGYTGELGYEIMVARDLAPWVWDELLIAGQPLGIMPAGVAARESLRTQAGYLLNGNDMDPQTNPIEAGLEWVVKPAKDFIGRDALARIKAQGVGRKLVGLEVQGHHTIRNGCPIFKGGKDVGKVTSGPLSRSVDRPQPRSRIRGDRARRDRHGAGCGRQGQQMQGARGRDALLPAQGQRGAGRQYPFPLRAALQRIACLGARRGGRRECHRHRTIGFRATQPGRHPQPGSAESRRSSKERRRRGMGRQLPSTVRSCLPGDRRSGRDQRLAGRATGAHQCLSVRAHGRAQSAYRGAA